MSLTTLFNRLDEVRFLCYCTTILGMWRVIDAICLWLWTAALPQSKIVIQQPSPQCCYGYCVSSPHLIIIMDTLSSCCHVLVVVFGFEQRFFDQIIATKKCWSLWPLLRSEKVRKKRTRVSSSKVPEFFLLYKNFSGGFKNAAKATRRRRRRWPTPRRCLPSQGRARTSALFRKPRNPTLMKSRMSFRDSNQSTFHPALTPTLRQSWLPASGRNTGAPLEPIPLVIFQGRTENWNTGSAQLQAFASRWEIIRNI